MAAVDIRLVAAELKVNTDYLYDQMQGISTDISLLRNITYGFDVTNTDGALPSIYTVQEALRQYEVLNPSISKPALSLNDSLAIIRAAE